MSLPSYRVRDEEEAYVPLLQASADERSSTTSKDAAQPPGYPPPEQGSSSSSARLPPLDMSSRPTVTCIFKPRYPVIASKSTVLGVLGRTKEETISIVQRGIPILAEFPTNRIELQVSQTYQTQHSGTQNRWVTIMDETWHTFEQEPPTEMRVLISDTEETHKARRHRRRSITCKIISYVIGCIIGLLVLIRMFR